MNRGFSKMFRGITLILAMGASMTANAGLFGFGGTSWKEEALQPDGSKIIVDRSIEKGGHNKPKDVITDETLAFEMPGTRQTITWEDKYGEDIGGASFLPMLLGIDQGIPYLVVSPMGCLSYNKWGRPNPPYVVFKYAGEEWKRIPLQELPSEIKTPNLIFSDPDNAVKRIGKSPVPADTISQVISRYPQPYYKTIVREPIPNGGQGRCGELIHIKNGWAGLGFFSMQHSYEACTGYCEQKGVAAQDCPCPTLFKEK